MKQGLVRLLYNFGKRFMGWTLHMIMCVLLCYPVSIRTYYQQGVLFLVTKEGDKHFSSGLVYFDSSIFASWMSMRNNSFGNIFL